VFPGEVRWRTHSSRSSIVSRVSLRRDFADARSGIDRVAREAEMQVQNEEVTLRDSTVEAQLLAQGERARAAKAVKAAKTVVDQAAQAQAQAQAARAQAAVVRAQSWADEAADAMTLVDIESQMRARAVVYRS
jgi:hypothetical protein